MKAIRLMVLTFVTTLVVGAIPAVVLAQCAATIPNPHDSKAGPCTLENSWEMYPGRWFCSYNCPGGSGTENNNY